MRTLAILTIPALYPLTIAAACVRGWWIDRRAAALHEAGGDV